ncbi:MAG: DNA-binding response regulator [Chloroflexi bacterium]|nr:MAG: DNA-binding response regulator [Chloroflexota bacterium]MBL1195120.1 DNA-binding response regulator [Chloroflexota bacterium]NOH12405.1 response regulator transcription factor [Chloroflexota bacterium]
MEALLFSQHTEDTATLTVVLQHAGFTVRSMRDLNQATSSWPEPPPDLIMVVVATAFDKAVAQIKQLRAHTVVPIAVLAEKCTNDYHVELLEAGVDLVLGTEFNSRVLLAQIRSLIRRTAGVPFFSLPTLTQANLSLDPGKRVVAMDDGEPKRLTQLEFRLLYTLMTHAGQIIPTENIVEYVWGYSGEGNRELVRGLVQRLRSKVESDPHKPRLILNEPNIGYYFNQYPDGTK